MISHTTAKFWKLYFGLPAQIRKQAKNAYLKFKKNTRHPSLHFKKVHEREPIYSVRISSEYRAVGIVDGATIVWFWIGDHREYEKLLQKSFESS